MKKHALKRLAGLAAGVVAAISAAGLLAGSVVTAEPAGPQSANLAGNAERGRELYVTYYCYACHGWSGRGGAGPAVAPSAYTAEGMIRYIRKPAGNMPPYTSRVMSDQQIADVNAWLETIPASPSADSIPLLAPVE